ncbi:unnamed protein product [Allacma fusca]|uniref:Uncharacterized protein n=1 Tax=Allacma fusca TaxID=39272 RepID=A0A8J2L4Z9_9HEXA|nr:unnamed protein product [Allacma fusca]
MDVNQLDGTMVKVQGLHVYSISTGMKGRAVGVIAFLGSITRKTTTVTTATRTMRNPPGFALVVCPSFVHHETFHAKNSIS